MFETVNHQLMITKLHAYGFGKRSLGLVFNHFRGRIQRTKINQWYHFQWLDLIVKGCPSGISPSGTSIIQHICPKTYPKLHKISFPCIVANIASIYLKKNKIYIYIYMIAFMGKWHFSIFDRFFWKLLYRCPIYVAKKEK